jgi:hemerythrin
MRLEWTKDLSVGVAEIDNQHRELFARTNDLLDAMKRGKGREDVGGLLSFLEDYTVMHFGLEEKFMLEYEYHDLQSHKRKHSQFIEKIREERKKLEAEGATVDIAARISLLLTQWWIDHIRNVDRLLGIFLKKRGVPSES